MPPPPPPRAPELPPKPDLDGPLADFSFGKLTASIEWLFAAIEALQNGQTDITEHLGTVQNIYARIELLERGKNPKTQTGGSPAKSPGYGASPTSTQAKRPPKPEGAELSTKETVDETGTARSEEESVGDTQSSENVAESFDPAAMAIRLKDMGFLQQADLSKAVTQACSLVKEDVSAQIEQQSEVIAQIKSEVGVCIQQSEFHEHKHVMEARFHAMDLLHEEDVQIREAAEQAFQVLKTRVGQLEEDLADLESRHGKRLDTCEAILEEHDDRLNAINTRMRAHDENFEEQDELRSRMQKNKGPVTLESLAHVDIETEVRRLRSMVECMEQSMGEDLQKTMAFFRQHERNGGGGDWASQASSRQLSSKKAMTTGSRPGNEMDGSTLDELREEFMERIHQAVENNDRDFKNAIKALKNLQRDHGALGEKVDDMWTRLPKVIALFEPFKLEAYKMGQEQDQNAASLIKANVGQEEATKAGKPSGGEQAAPTATKVDCRGRQGPADAAAGGAVGKSGVSVGDGHSEMQLTVNVINSMLQGSFDDVRAEFQHDLALLHDEIGKRATSQEVDALANRLDAWTQHSPGLARRRERNHSEERAPSPVGGVGLQSPSAFKPPGTAPSPFMKSQGRSSGDRTSGAPQGRPLGVSGGIAAADLDRSLPTATYKTDTSVSFKPGSVTSVGTTWRPGHGDGDKQKFTSCHEKCKQPSCPKSLLMSQSLGRLPKLQAAVTGQ
eukprot:TRINITY_DN67666_c0_g1_i1.p1 TRINITY_DN67666_c0_g1~~TRINITY_DN67666_c0_g1_i1.p1  ORF type:complete len:729 (-),score=143.21 TRINITY_DN67666_c0_g1_i1:188-2374(-)